MVEPSPACHATIAGVFPVERPKMLSVLLSVIATVCYLSAAGVALVSIITYCVF